MTSTSVAKKKGMDNMSAISYDCSDVELDLLGKPVIVPRSKFGQVTRRLGFHAANQGQSDLATPFKQRGLIGLYHTLTLKQKNLHEKGIKTVVYVDMYSGVGENVANGQRIYGSPISMLEGIYRAVTSMKGELIGKRMIIFNDIVKGRASEMLPNRVLEWQQLKRLQRNPELLVLHTKDGYQVDIPIHYRDGSAQTMAEAISFIIDGAYKDSHFIIAIDPNGPKDAPWSQVRDLWEKNKRRIDLIFHISATTLKRTAKARDAGLNINPNIPNHIQGLLDNFSCSKGWIRSGVGADYWTLMLLTEFPPKYGWGADVPFHLINSPEGQEVIRSLSLTKKEKAEVAL